MGNVDFLICLLFRLLAVLFNFRFLADRTNGRAYTTVLRPSSVVVVCDLVYCG